ncbi:MAG: NlpC/P60 family protein [Myxococcaceae bacterium]
MILLAGCTASRSTVRGDAALTPDASTDALVLPVEPLPDGPPSHPSEWIAWPGEGVVGTSLLLKVSRWVGLSSLRKVSRRVPDDCSGLVRLAYLEAGLPLAPSEGKRGDNMTTALWRRVDRLGALRIADPKPGDLVFFSETYDRNRDGRRNDGLTHIGIVEEVLANGTVVFIHRGDNGVKRSRMNLLDGARHKDENGEVLNDWLRRRDRKHRAYLAGELLTGFASPDTLVEEQSDASEPAS